MAARFREDMEAGLAAVNKALDATKVRTYVFSRFREGEAWRFEYGGDEILVATLAGRAEILGVEGERWHLRCELTVEDGHATLDVGRALRPFFPPATAQRSRWRLCLDTDRALWRLWDLDCSGNWGHRRAEEMGCLTHVDEYRGLAELTADPKQTWVVHHGLAWVEGRTAYLAP